MGWIQLSRYRYSGDGFSCLGKDTMGWIQLSRYRYSGDGFSCLGKDAVGMDSVV